MRTRFVFVAGTLAAALAAAGLAQTPNAFLESRDHAAIRYSTAPLDNRITALNRALADGSNHLLRRRLLEGGPEDGGQIGAAVRVAGEVGG